MALTTAELQQRKRGIFSTDAAAALGMSKYGSPVSVWLEKTADSLPEEDEEPDQEKTEALSMGLIMQPVIGRLYEARTGQSLRDLDGVTMWSDKVSFMGSHFDFHRKDDKKYLVEAKNFHDMRRKDFGDPGSDDVPMDCLVQCLHEGFVFGAEVVDLAVLFGGQKFEIFTIPVTQSAVEILIEKLSAFWRLVETREPPPPQTPEDIKHLFKRDNGAEVFASAEVEQMCAKLSQVKESLKKTEELKENLEVLIKAELGENSVLRSQSGQILASWKNSKDEDYFDKKKFKLEHESLYESYFEKKPGKRPFLLK